MKDRESTGPQGGWDQRLPNPWTSSCEELGAKSGAHRLRMASNREGELSLRSAVIVLSLVEMQRGLLWEIKLQLCRRRPFRCSSGQYMKEIVLDSKPLVVHRGKMDSYQLLWWTRDYILCREEHPERGAYWLNPQRL